ncbi:winged helix-turn-helix transcriptional regulator [Limosilactobacillus pontis]|uniref:Winged helix-turn-helix transcriptional regulator n=1 Tax=Limosilactobacillus pontis TaxID=35787 RepID=A0ABU7SR36_9LACO
MSAFAGKYKTRIICSLMTHGPMRHKELRQLTDANDQALSLALKELLDYSIVNRHQYNEMPLLHQVSLWAIKHHEDDVTFEHDNSRLG